LRYVSALEAIRHLSLDAAEQLAIALESSPVSSKSEEMFQRIKDRVSGIPPEELEGIVDVLYALYNVREYSELKRASFLRELIDGIQEAAGEPIREPEASIVRARFRRLLSVESLNSISKAIRLQRNEERVYCHSGIVSDIRPVFGADVNENPVAAVIVHKLEIGFHKDGEHRKIFISLDEVDLEALGEVIDRARLKSQTLKNMLSGANLPRLGA
jgi:hypothetical protein